MPTYSYKCDSCGATKDKFQKTSDAPLVKCDVCQEDSLKRAPGYASSSLQFKGANWTTNGGKY